VSFDSPAANQRFAEKYDFNFPLLCDVDRTMGVAYGATDDAKAKGGAKRIGVVIGPDGKIKHYLPKVDARAFPQQALDLI
jgi:peroxiredoxin Q/BCP